MTAFDVLIRNGLVWVLVNGKLTVENDSITGVRAGKVLRFNKGKIL